MKRLTRVDEDGTVLCIGCAEEEECNGDCLSCQHDIDAIQKLAEYEDAEEQGLLLRLPVAEGSKVWEVKEYFDCKCDYDCHESIHFKCDLKRPCEHEFKVYRVIERKFEKRMLSRIGTTIFLTKEEAEQALAKMEGGV